LAADQENRLRGGPSAEIAPSARRLPIAMICVSLNWRCRKCGHKLRHIMAATRLGGTNEFAVR
jgi:hypothetical protein